MSMSTLETVSALECETVGQLSKLLTDLDNPGEAICSRHRWYLPIRFVLDWLLALVFFVLSAPVIALAALLVKWTSPGPMFYCQQRVGKNGRIFKVIKLRTMVDDAEALSGPVWAGEEDVRITPIGRFLRYTHLDEFPQLINVLLGQMSLVGPRPERPEFVAELEWKLPHYRTRLKLRPGITGLTQLKLPPDTSLDGVSRKLVFDLYYICAVNPWLDLRILTATGWFLLGRLWRYLRKCVALPSSQAIERNLNSIQTGFPRRGEESQTRLFVEDAPR